MAPRKDRRERAPEQKILDTAADLLRKHGLGRTTVVDIAEAAGMSHANVYRYFPSKAALIDEVVAVWTRSIERDLRVVAEGPDPAQDKLERILLGIHRAYRDKLDRDPRIFAIFAKAARENRGVARKHRMRIQSELQRTIEEGIAERNFGVSELRRALALTFDLCHRFVHPAAIESDADTPRAAIDMRAARVVRLLLWALTSGRD